MNVANFQATLVADLSSHSNLKFVNFKESFSWTINWLVHIDFFSVNFSLVKNVIASSGMFQISKQPIKATETSDNHANTKITQTSQTCYLGWELTLNRLTWLLFTLKSLNLIAFQANRSENLRVRNLLAARFTTYLWLYGLTFSWVKHLQRFLISKNFNRCKKREIFTGIFLNCAILFCS